MKTNKRLITLVPVLVGLTAILPIIAGMFLASVLPGCGRTTQPTSTKTSNTDGGDGNKQTPIDLVRLLASQTMDLPKAVEVVKSMNEHLGQDLLAKEKVQKDRPDETLLKERYKLTKEEIQRVSSASFSAVDAFHIEHCFRMRDVADALEVKKLPPLEQARRAFDWVTRQVILDNLDDDMIPPAFALKLGRGSATERAVLFIDLLNQLNLPACLIDSPPDGSSKPAAWAVGVLVKEKDSANIYLFDPRLGLPIPGPGGKGVATLKEVRANPKILEQQSPSKEYPYDVDAEQAKKAEIILAPTIPSLSPRMAYLENQLNKQMSIELAVEPDTTIKQFEDLKAGNVHVWNKLPEDEKAALPITPVRVWRTFLPPQQGGMGSEIRFQDLQWHLISWPLIHSRYDELGVTGSVPSDAYEKLRTLSEQLINRYILTPQDKLARANLDGMLGPIDRIKKVVAELNRGPQMSTMSEKVEQWCKQVKSAYALEANALNGKAQLAAIWDGDPYLAHLLLGDDETLAKSQKGTLSYIVIYASAEALSRDSLYLLSLWALQKAAQSQNLLRRYEAGGQEPPERMVNEAESNWENAVDWCQKYVSRYGITPKLAGLPSRIERIKADVREDPLDETTLEQFVKELQRSLSLRYQQIDALAMLGKKKSAHDLAKQLAEDVQQLRQSSAYTDLVDQIKTAVTQAPNLNEATRQRKLNRLEQLGDYFDAYGSVYWYGHAAALRAAALGKQ